MITKKNVEQNDFFPADTGHQLTTVWSDYLRIRIIMMRKWMMICQMHPIKKTPTNQ